MDLSNQGLKYHHFCRSLRILRLNFVPFAVKYRRILTAKHHYFFIDAIGRNAVQVGRSGKNSGSGNVNNLEYILQNS
jgi:hypothetical protein